MFVLACFLLTGEAGEEGQGKGRKAMGKKGKGRKAAPKMMMAASNANNHNVDDRQGRDAEEILLLSDKLETLLQRCSLAIATF